MFESVSSFDKKNDTSFGYQYVTVRRNVNQLNCGDSIPLTREFFKNEKWKIFAPFLMWRNVAAMNENC